jgi:hydroxymethylpyrimidine/phosphomethylpyrimidine kinase
MTNGHRPVVALTIAGSDSGGGAGIQADLKTFAAHGVYGTSALTAVTAQNTEAVKGVSAVAADFVALQIDAVVEDIGVDAAKTGMLGASAVIAVVAQKLDEHHIEKTVVDPVMVAKSGDRLLEPEAIAVLKRELIPRAYVVTPNLPEAEAIVGFAVDGEEAIKGAARQIVEMGAKAVVIKGGHAKGDESIDWLYDGRRFSRFASPRFDTRNTHGTGCTFSAAITAQLARGAQLEAAVRAAKRYLSAALERGVAIGRGHGPVDHFMGETVWPRP